MAFALAPWRTGGCGTLMPRTADFLTALFLLGSRVAAGGIRVSLKDVKNHFARRRCCSPKVNLLLNK
jgi:hypothetical protein